ncbi:Linear gramicidin dehydrogenase LgrE [compost metagenome]|uniref:Putative cadicidin biosynthesis thioesterase n=1 Tax=Pseudomonas wadenswilerensis TaxID=1785161 RepID=A0A380SYP6_9PSED|nr:alpha/beta fold hydrolase [Pseudomonas wadenswilerensis]SUQ62845.1 putative cadicidin biosynthesis thioesterase [Pseudomonas wadenswilerensis]
MIADLLTQTERWVRPYRLSPMPRWRLVCFAHAGGSASFFRDWACTLPADIDLLAIQYPGREDRFSEPCLTDMHSLAEAASQALRGYADRPLALFGHSLGAVVAYEVATRLEQQAIAVGHLFVSAHPAPQRQRGGQLHSGPDQALLDDVQRLSSRPNPLLEDPALREMFMPSLRNDYRIVETYGCAAPQPLSSRIAVFYPEQDPEIDLDEALAWQAASLQPLHLQRWQGEHFYLIEQRQALLDALAATLLGCRPLTSPALEESL